MKVAGVNSNHRRGVAMLLVLGTLVVAVTACATLSSLAATAALSRRCAVRLQEADDLLRSADAPIVSWLNLQSSCVVLPPECDVPEVPVLFDAWTGGGVRVSIRITAYDQFGMLPAGLASSSLRLALPPAIADIASRITRLTAAGQILGLDTLAQEAEERSVDLFPVPGDGSASDGPAGAVDASKDAVGACIGTHNSGRLVNINTAPMRLVEATLRLAGRGGTEEIRRARAQGQAAIVPPPVSRTASEDTLSPVPSPGSHVWSFRIDASVGPVERSVWTVYSADSGQWGCVQRLVIDR
jgi:hypothetical protein